MVVAASSKRCALVSMAFALAQLAGAVSAGWFFVQGDHDWLASASMAFTGAVMLVNRWHFRGWRELRPAWRGQPGRL